MMNAEKMLVSEMHSIRNDFPTLNQMVNGHPLVYLDNAATAQKPAVVIERMNQYYREENANVHRGIHTLSQRATDEYEKTRQLVAEFIHSPNPESVVFTSGATEAINLAVSGYFSHQLKQGDEILLTEMEHHSNIVPWQMAAEKTGAVIKVIPVTDAGELDMDAYIHLLTGRVKVVALVHMSNTLGTINPVTEITRLAHEAGALVLVDGSQSTPHFRVNVQEMDCDFFVFSGHKVFGPTGTGILYGKLPLLEETRPFHGGGNMIKTVTFEKTTYHDVPFRFEAGTPNIAGGIGLGSAISYLNGLNWEDTVTWEHQLLEAATAELSEIPGLRIIGTAKEKGAVISFVMADAHPADIGTILDQQGIAIRTGHHCTQPLMRRFKVPATARASFAFYNTMDDVERLVKAVKKVSEIFV